MGFLVITGGGDDGGALESKLLDSFDADASCESSMSVCECCPLGVRPNSDSNPTASSSDHISLA